MKSNSNFFKKECVNFIPLHLIWNQINSNYEELKDDQNVDFYGLRHYARLIFSIYGTDVDDPELYDAYENRMYWTVTFEITLDKRFHNRLEAQFLKINNDIFNKIEEMLLNYQEAVYDLGSLQLVECTVFSLPAERKSNKFNF